MKARGIAGPVAVAVVLIMVAAGLILGCGSEPQELGFSGKWVSTGGSELTLEIGAAEDGVYPVTFVGGDVKRTLSATQKDDAIYRAEGQTDTWIFRLVGDDLMNVTIIPAEGEQATTSFKRQ